jgi:PAS domain S-box-containing protein
MSVGLSHSSSNKKFGEILTRALTVPLVLLAVLVGLLAFQVRNLMGAMAWVDHTDQAISEANQVRYDLISLQNGIRGFVIANNPYFLENYRSFETSLKTHVEKLKATVSDNSEQQARINDLSAQILAWQDWANQVIASEGAHRNVSSQVISGEGERGMRILQDKISDVIGAEDSLRSQRHRQVQASARQAILLAAGLTLLLGGFLAYFSRRQLLSLAKIYQESQDSVAKYAAQEGARAAEARYRQLVDSIKDYAIIMLDTRGNVTSWTSGAEKIKGYKADEIIGKHVSTFYLPEDAQSGKAETELRVAAAEGRYEDENWRVRKDGTRFWANVILVPLRDHNGIVTGYAKVTRDLTERKKIEDELRRNSVALAAANKELEAFSYAVSHDLRAPLRGIDGFSQALMEDYGNELNDEAKDYLKRIRGGVQRMGRLIDDLLNLSRLTRGKMVIGEVNLSQIAKDIVNELKERDPTRDVDVKVQDGLVTQGDAGLITAALENLISNAWKFSSKTSHAQIEFGSISKNDETVYYVRDNGAGFDMAYADKLFGAFQRLHHINDFQGTGIGLATVRRVILRHGGNIWADSQVGKGATFYFTLNTPVQDQQQAA